MARTVTMVAGVTYATEPIDVGDGPSAILFEPIENRIYVANELGNSVTAYDLDDEDNETIPVGSGPNALVASANPMKYAARSD